MALVTDALRGQLQSVLLPGATVAVGAPSPDGPAVLGLFVHPLRIAVSRALRNLPSPVRIEDNLAPPLVLELDYLIAGLGGETLAELALLDAALQSINESPMRTHASLGEGLSQPERWASLASGSLTVRWSLLDLPLEQVSGVWVGCGMRQRAGVFVRGEVSWRAGQKPLGPIVEIELGRVVRGDAAGGAVSVGQ